MKFPKKTFTLDKETAEILNSLPKEINSSLYIREAIKSYYEQKNGFKNIQETLEKIYAKTQEIEKYIKNGNKNDKSPNRNNETKEQVNPNKKVLMGLFDATLKLSAD